MLVLRSAGLGEGEPDLGEKLLRAFLSELLESGILPARIICMNTGIFLTTGGVSGARPHGAARGRGCRGPELRYLPGVLREGGPPRGRIGGQHERDGPDHAVREEGAPAVITLRCTRKLQQHLGVKPEPQDMEPTSALGDWYGNLVFMPQGSPLVLVSNERTLLSVVLHHDSDVLTEFKQRVIALLRRLEFPEAAVEREIFQLQQVRIGETRNRRVLGSMNDAVVQLRARLFEHPHGPATLEQAEDALVENLYSMLKYVPPADVARELLGAPARPRPSAIRLESKCEDLEHGDMGEGERSTSAAEGESEAHTGPDDIDEFVASLKHMLKRLKVAQARARMAGIFPCDRELLTCTSCGQMEDVLADGRLITYRKESIGRDTGLRFVETGEGTGWFTCPNCGSEVREEEPDE